MGGRQRRDACGVRRQRADSAEGDPPPARGTPGRLRPACRNAGRIPGRRHSPFQFASSGPAGPSSGRHAHREDGRGAGCSSRKPAHLRWAVGFGVAEVSGATAGLTGVTVDHVAAMATIATSRAAKMPMRTRRFMRGSGIPCGVVTAKNRRRRGIDPDRATRSFRTGPTAGHPPGGYRPCSRASASQGGDAWLRPSIRDSAAAACSARVSSRRIVASSGMTEAHQ
jgi:hypothetical protein